MITEPRPLPRRPLRLARTAATVMLTLLLAVATAACSTPASPSTPAAGGDVPAHAAAPRDDPRFRDTFRHECADVDGVRMHDARVVGHDLGAAVAFQYASQFPDDNTAPLGYLDLPLPGPAIDAGTYRSLSWHIAFHSQRRVPEAVVDDDIRAYLALFYPQVSFGGTAFGGTSDRSPFTDAEIDEYARTYSRPDGLSGGFDLSRALDEDVRDTVAAAPVGVPTGTDIPSPRNRAAEPVSSRSPADRTEPRE